MIQIRRAAVYGFHKTGCMGESTSDDPKDLSGYTRIPTEREV
jgi:hypothetical protein